MAPAGDDDEQLPTTKGAEDGAPPESEEDYVEAVTRHAKYLGMDPERDGTYMWIAEEALNAKVPEGWVTGEGEGEYEGLVYYYNEATGESTWDHPLDEYYREKFKRKKARRAARENDDKGNRQDSKSRASASKSRASRSTCSRRHRSGDDTANDERSESRSRREHTKEKDGSSNGVANGDQGSQSSGRRDNAKRSKTRKVSRRHRDDGERSRHRSTSSRSQRTDDNGDGRDERRSSKHRRNASNGHSDSGRAHRSEEEDGGRRRKEEGRRRRGSGRERESSSGRHQCRTRDKTRRSSSGDGESVRSKLDEPPEKREKQVEESPSKSPRPDKHHSRSQERGRRDENRESFEPDRKERGRGSRQEVSMQLEETNRGGRTTVATVSGDLAAAADNWRTKSIVGGSTYSHNEKKSHHDANRSAADSRKGNAGSQARRGGFREDTDRESGHRTANTTVERAESVVNEIKSNTLCVQKDPGNKVDMPAVHRSVDGRSATQASTAAWKNNDMEEIDFEDELRDMEEGDGGPNVRHDSPTEMEAPDTEPQGRSPSAVSEVGSDTKNQGEPLPSPPMFKAAAIAGDDKARQSRSRDHPNKAGKGNKLGNEDEPHSRRDTSGERGVKSRENGLPATAGTADPDLDDWPEVASNPAKERAWGDSGTEQKGKRYSNAHGTQTVRESRVETGRRGRERDDQPDVVFANGVDRNRIHGEDSDDHRRGTGATQGYDRHVERTSERESRRLRHGGGIQRDRDSGMASPRREDRTDRNDRQGGHSGRRSTAKGSTASPRQPSGNHGGDCGADQYSSGDRWDHQYSSFGDVEGQRWGGGERVSAMQRDRRDEDVQPMTREKDKLERQLQQQQHEAAEKARELETKVHVGLGCGWSFSEIIKHLRRHLAVEPEHNRSFTHHLWHIFQMSVAGVAGKEKEEGLRLELKNALKRAEAAEGALARKEEAEKVPAERESEVPRLQLLLANKESEAASQGRELVEMQSRLAEALKKAASEMSALNHALSRARDEVSFKESEIAKAGEEASRLRVQLGLAQEKLRNAERTKAAFESEAESFRARAAELQSANASMEREMRNSQQDALSRWSEQCIGRFRMGGLEQRIAAHCGKQAAERSVVRSTEAKAKAVHKLFVVPRTPTHDRLRESERERDAAVYEGKRSTELAASAETWRLKETLRADAAEAKALSTGTEVAELRSEAARLRTSMDAVVAPHVKRNVELQRQVEDARREAADLTAEVKRLQESHASELSSLKDEVSRKLPWIAEKAVAEARKHFRQKAEEDMKAFRADRDRRLEELQILQLAALVEESVTKKEPGSVVADAASRGGWVAAPRGQREEPTLPLGGGGGFLQQQTRDSGQGPRSLPEGGWASRSGANPVGPAGVGPGIGPDYGEARGLNPPGPDCGGARGLNPPGEIPVIRGSGEYLDGYSSSHQTRVTVNTPLLDGKSCSHGFDSWRKSFIQAAKTIDLDGQFMGDAEGNIPVGDPNLPTSKLLRRGHMRAEVQRELQAFHFIITAVVKEADKAIISNCTSAKEFLTELEKVYDPESQGSKQALMRKIFDFAIHTHSNSNPIEHLYSLELLYTRLREKGLNAEQPFVLAHFVGSLPPEYQQSKFLLETATALDRAEIVRIVSTVHASLPEGTNASKGQRRAEHALLASDGSGGGGAPGRGNGGRRKGGGGGNQKGKEDGA
ncbi:unnamed protein product [Ectocarpus sp. CCAP 1310/34]|nr:unnamed protein product [Ectocarpus sp. CCAP 1310/34]